jgi:probable phosphoglycerate mutase
MKLYFVRHGESEANVLNVISNRNHRHALTAVGRRQALDLAASLQHVRPTVIYTSPLLRAVQTAQLLSQAPRIECEPADALREFDCGAAEGRSDPAAWHLHHRVLADWLQRGILEARIEGGESFIEMRARFVPFVECIARDRVHEPAAILVGHGGLYSCLLPLVLVNIHLATGRPFPNAGYVLAEVRPTGLVCLEWCGTPLKEVPS